MSSVKSNFHLQSDIIIKQDTTRSVRTTSTESMSDTSDELLTSPTSSKLTVNKSKTSGRRKRTSKSRGRQVLMDMIAQEVSKTLQDDDEDDVSPQVLYGADGSRKYMSSEELFYAQMNGEVINVVSSVPSTVSTSKNEDTDDDDDTPSENSFTGLTLLPEDVLTTSERSRSSTDSLSKSGRSKSSRSSESSEDTLSIDEIKQYVMASMPEEVRNKIPKEAWAQIFNTTAADKIRKPTSKASMTAKKDDEEEKVESETKEEDTDDNDSVISDITEFTSFPKDQPVAPTNDKAPFILEPEDNRWDEELCPGLNKGSFAARSSESSCVASNETVSLSVSYRTDVSTGSIIPNKTSGVQFSTVQIRYYERILDINPAVTNGVAIGIGWRYKRGGKMHVDDWEVQRGGVTRRSDELLLPRHVRERIVKELGYTQKDIAEATRIILKAKNRRKATVSNLGAQGMEEAVESASRSIRGLLSFGRQKGLLKT